MAKWALTEEGKMMLEKYVSEDIGFGINQIKDSGLFEKIQGDNFTNILSEKIDRKSVYSTKAVSMRQLARCYMKKSVVWGIKMNLLIGLLLYRGDMSADELSGKLEITKATANEHISLLEECGLIKKKDMIAHIPDFYD